MLAIGVVPGRGLGSGRFSDGFIRSFVTRDPSFDTRTWDANNWLASLSLVGALYQAFNPDLSGLKARGAKLILWNGTNDTAISPSDTQRYYNRVVRRWAVTRRTRRSSCSLPPASATAPAAPDPTRSTS